MVAKQVPPSQTSIILVGQRGSGLSSFAVITSQLTGFEVIDVDARFVQQYSSTRAACLRAWGEQHYRDVANRFFRDLLLHHQECHVLLCASYAADPSVHSLLRECSPDVPVVMVNRDMSAVRHRLGLADSDYTAHILNTSQSLCRRSSNVELYNLPEEQGPRAVSELLFRALRSDQSPGHCIRRLQNVTQDVARFLRLMGYCVGGCESITEIDTLASREFPAFVSLHLQDIVQTPSLMAEVDCSSDALQLSVPCNEAGPGTDNTRELISKAFQTLRRHSSLPIIYHVEFETVLELNNTTLYTNLCRHGLRLLPEYATVDLQCSDEEIAALVAASRRCTRVIAHRTFSASEKFSWKDPLLLEQCRRAAALGCHHVRLIRFSASPSEDRDCVSFQVLANAASDIIVSAICIHKFARSSAVSSMGLVPVSQSNFSSTEYHESLPTLQDLNRARFSSFVFQPLHFHVFGASVHYSMSPAMHNTALELLGFQHSYTTCQSSSVSDLAALFDDTFGGASVSLPFKSEVMRFLQTVSVPARFIQAVNTIIPLRTTIEDAAWSPQSLTVNRQKNKAGKIVALHGENTDWAAMRNCISRQLSAANSVTPLTTALVIGAGGMARAAVYALMSLGVRNIMIWNRTLLRAQQLVDHFKNMIQSQDAGESSTQTRRLTCEFHILKNLTDSWPTDMKQPSIVVCTPPSHAVGKDPGLDFLVPEHWFRSATGGVVVEVSLTFPKD